MDREAEQKRKARWMHVEQFLRSVRARTPDGRLAPAFTQREDGAWQRTPEGLLCFDEQAGVGFDGSGPIPPNLQGAFAG
jgi:hypothetical protein